MDAINTPASTLPWYLTNYVLPLLVLITIGGFGAMCSFFKAVIKDIHDREERNTVTLAAKDAAFFSYLEAENARGRQERAEQRALLLEHTEISKGMYRTLESSHAILKEIMDDRRRERRDGRGSDG